MEEVTAPLGTQKSSGTQVGSAPSPPPLGAATMGGVEAPTEPVTNVEPSVPASTQAPTQTDPSTQEPQLIDRIESEMSGITAFAAIEEVGVDVAFTTLQ
ncbi:Intestinal mucin [Sesbania bispinosa]|nr:Intestinal mucin [Sesbania bispinosa]